MRFCILLLLGALPAIAAVPEKGEGDITLLGGVRAILPSNSDYINEQGATHSALHYGGLASFGYQYDDELHFKIEIGYLTDRYKVPAGDLTVRTIPLLLAIDTALWRGSAFTLYGGGGIGYSLNSGIRPGSTNEANSTAAYLAVGFRFQIKGPLALVIEDRWTLASAQVDAGRSNLSLNVGGNLLSLGLMFHFLQPEEKSYTPTR